MQMTRDEWNALCEAEAAGDMEAVRAIFRMLEDRQRENRDVVQSDPNSADPNELDYMGNKTDEKGRKKDG